MTQVEDAAEAVAAADRPVERRGVDAEHVLDLLQQVERIAARQVELVDEGDERQVAQPHDLEQLAGLRLDALGGVDDHHRAVHGVERAVGVLAEVLVAGRVEQGDAAVAEVEVERRRGHRDAALALHVHPVRHGVPLRLAAADGAGQLDGAGVEQQLLGEGRLAGVGVRDDRERPAPAHLGGEPGVDCAGRREGRSIRGHSTGYRAGRGQVESTRIIAVSSARSVPVAPLVGGALGAVFCLAVFGPAMVRPTNLGWTMRHDTQTYVLAFHHFRREPWQWPPGAISGVGYPVGTSVGNSDAIPVVAFPLKLLHGALPDPLQYLGAWVLLCYVLQGLFGVLLVRQATADPWLQVMGSALFVQAPALLNRFGHTALCAHFTLLAAIWIATDRVHGWSWRLGAWLLLCAATAAIQPYIAVMVVGLALAMVASDAWIDRRAGGAVIRFAGALVGIIGVTVAVFWICGYFLVGSATDLGLEGFGYFSMNLLSPVNGQGYSGLLPAFASATPGQDEGLVYFGLGWLALTAVALGLTIRGRGGWPRLRLGWIVVAGFLLLAISPVVTFGPLVVVDLQPWTPRDSPCSGRADASLGWGCTWCLRAR